MSPTDDESGLATCLNVTNCPKARTGEPIPWYPGTGEFCPECGEELRRLRRRSPALALTTVTQPDNRALTDSVRSPSQNTKPRHLALRSHRNVRFVSSARLPRPRRADATNNSGATSVSYPAPEGAQQSPVARSRRSPAAVPIALFFAAVMSIVGLILFRPRIVGLIVPRIAQPEALLTVTYRATAIGSAGYTVLGPDGQTVDHAPLGLGTGTFALTLPRSSATQTYLLRLYAGNALASTTADYYVRVPVARVIRRVRTVDDAPQVIQAPQIRSLALDRATLAGGDALGVYYDVLATGGTIALVDSASQRTYAKAQLATSGHTSFTMPPVADPRLLTVVLTAQRGTQTIQSRVGVTVVPPDASPAPDGPASDTAAAGVLSAPPTVQSRRPIHVEVRGASADVQVVLLDTSGTEFERRDVRPGQSGVNFTAPDVRITTHFTFEATFPKGDGSETLVRGIAVTP